MKILITSDFYLPAINGVVTSVQNLAKELTRKNHEVRILTLSDNIQSHNTEQVMYLGSVSARSVYPGARLRVTSSRSSIKEIMEWKPDVVHSQCEFSTFGLANKIAKKLNIPLIHTYHTVYEDYTHYFSPNKKLGRQIVSLLSNHIANKCDYMIAPTSKVEKILNGYNISCKVKVIPSGIDLNKYRQNLSVEEKTQLKKKLSISDDKKVGIFVGRIAKEKNLSELLELWKNVDGEKAVFLIVGGGPYIDEIKKQAQELEIEDKVRFTGMIAPELVWKYYKLGDFFLSASNSETQGLTYIEAVSSGLPLLCKADECLDDVIERGINGWQYNDELEFYEKLNELLSWNSSDISSRDKIASTVEKYSTERFAEVMESLYLESMKGKKSHE